MFDDDISDIGGEKLLHSRFPEIYNWKPKDDITAYELAMCIPVLLIPDKFSVAFSIMELPENAKRHFEKAVQS